MFAYRVGFPGWKLAAKLGIPLKVVVSVIFDPASGYFTALSDDFNPQAGIAAEAKTWDELVSEVNIEIEEAMEFIFKIKHEDTVTPYFVPATA